jgi:gliding motility-associated-like protein
MKQEFLEATARAEALLKRVSGLVRPLGAALAAAALLLASPAAALNPSSRLNIGVNVQVIGGVSDLAAQTGTAAGEVNLTWTEPFHPSATPPVAYDMRVSSIANIGDNAAFLAAQPLTAFTGTPLPAPGAGGGQAAVVITGLAPGVVHYFALRVKDALGAAGFWARSSGWNQANFAVAKTITPAPITDLTGLTGPGGGQVTLNWTAPAPPVLVNYRVIYATFSVASVGGSTTAWRALALSSSTVIPAAAAPGVVETATLTLTPGVKYFFGVETTNTSGTGNIDALASAAQVNVRAQGLGAITDLSAASGPMGTGINLTWTEPFVSSVTAPVSYQIKVSTLGFINGATDYAAAQDLNAISTITIPSYAGGGGIINVNDFGLTPFTTYYFAVRLVDGSTPTATGAWLRVPAIGQNLNTSALPLFVPNPPNPVSDLTALPGAAEGDVALVWTAPANANLVRVASYEVRFATFSASSVGSTTTWTAAASSAAFGPALQAGATEGHVIGGLFPASTWYFSIKSIDITGQISPIDTKSTGTLQASTLPRSLPPSTPTGLAAIAGMRRATISWTDLPPAGKGLDFAYYRLERSTDLVTFVAVTTTTSTGYLDAPLKAKVTDYYRLVAHDLRGNDSVACSTVSAVPYTIIPMEPLGITVAATPLNVTFTWSPVTRFADSTPFISTTTPDVDELIGYTVYRSTEACGPLDFVHVSSLPVLTTTLVNATGGLNYFYHIQSYNTQGLSTNTVTISSLGDRSFFLDQCDTVMMMDAANSSVLNAATNGRGADIRIAKTRRPQDVGGSIFQSAEWRAFLGGVTELAGFTLPKPARIVMHYDTLGGVVVPTTAPVSGLAVAGNGAAPAAVSPKDVGMYWYNGGDFKKMYGAVDVNSQTVTIDSPNLGLYQVRALFRADGAVFDLSNISGRVITPNGDGLNDSVIFTYDPGPRNAQVRGRIYDMTGSFVADMVSGLVPNTLAWNGKMNGRAVTSGVYIYKIEGDGKTFTGTVVVAR